MHPTNASPGSLLDTDTTPTQPQPIGRRIGPRTLSAGLQVIPALTQLCQTALGWFPGFWLKRESGCWLEDGVEGAGSG